jgi:hypothetical protein
MLVLGFLAALGSGAGGGGGGNSNFTFDGSEFESMPFETIPELSQNMEAVAAAMAAAGAIIAGLLCFLFIVAIIFWLVRLTAQAGLIDAAYRLDAGEKMTFGEAISAGWQRLGRMVGLNIVLFGVFFLLALIGGVVLAIGVGATVGGAATGDGELGAALGAGLVGLICCFMCIFLLVAIVVNVIYPFAQRAVVLEDKGVMASISRGWQVIKENLGEIIILILIFVLLGMVVGALTLAVTLPVAALAFAPTLIRLFSGGAIEVLDIVLASGGLLCIILFAAAINAIFVAFRSSVVTLAYGEFTGKTPATVIAE